jgi:hypothetical protein
LTTFSNPTYFTPATNGLDGAGFNARYEPYDTPGVGLSDGDPVGVTDEPPTNSDPYTDGAQGYQISDVDGNFILEFDPVATGSGSNEVSIDYFIAETGYEGDGTSNTSGSDRLRIYVKDLTNSTETDILNTTGSDINDLGIEGSWITGSVSLPSNIDAQLVIEARTNSGTEAFFFDHVVFDGSLNVTNEEENRFTLVPNPAVNGYVNISSNIPGHLDVNVYDLLGNRLLSDRLAASQLDVKRLNSGIYLIEIRQDKVTTVKKLIVQ